MYVVYNHLVKKPANRAQFAPDIEYWLDPNNTYRVVFITIIPTEARSRQFSTRFEKSDIHVL